MVFQIQAGGSRLAIELGIHHDFALVCRREAAGLQLSRESITEHELEEPGWRLRWESVTNFALMYRREEAGLQLGWKVVTEFEQEEAGLQLSWEYVTNSVLVYRGKDTGLQLSQESIFPIFVWCTGGRSQACD